MVVCICNAIREKDLRAAAQKGASTPSSAYAQMGCKARCGQCVSFARQIIRSETATA
ncbi:MAG: (2Fe-2S)-binding protein [Parasphingopyxis sp.]|jgi:bacterioferritin-associated ferredoxin|uniref:(2Fe-2S)-binding protein n=1 Tax=Parasphingopyxis sp. TaxID=1920299 RepID=UPI003FA0DCF1